MAAAEQFQYTLSGLRTLKEQEIDLQQAEIAGRWLLVEYKCGERSELGAGTGETKPLNYATFENTPNRDAPGKIELKEVLDESELKGLKDAQADAGRKYVLCSPAYVSGALSKVAVFR